MKAPNITPGNWHTIGFSDTEDRRKLIVVAGDGNGGRPVIGISDGNPQGEANARFIAAAPAMAETLAKLRRYFGNDETYCHGVMEGDGIGDDCLTPRRLVLSALLLAGYVE